MGLHCAKRIRLYLKAESGTEPYCPEDPERILMKAFIGIAYRTDKFLGAVILSSFRIVDLPFGIHIHGVDREIPAPDVFLYRSLKNDFIRSSHVRVRSIFPEGRNLDISFGSNGRNRAVLCGIVVIVDSGILENAYGLIRLGGCSYVVVVGSLS